MRQLWRRRASSAGACVVSEVFERRFVIVSGKGGVGKSTVSAALGLAAARRGRRTCIVQLHTRDTIGRHFGLPPIGYTPVRLDPTLPLWGTMLRPRDALREYSLMKLRFRALHRLVFENDIMRRVVDMMPGITEILLLGKAWHMEHRETDADGNPAWDTLILDAPSTGHGISLLRLPEVVLGAVSSGPLADDARHMQELLTDPVRTSFNIVTLAQELAVNETIELAATAREVIGVPVGNVFANCLLPPLFDAAQMDLLTAARGNGGGELVQACVAAADHYHYRRARQAEQLARLGAEQPMTVVPLPHLLRTLDRAGIEQLSECCVAGVTGTVVGSHAAARP